MGLAFLRFRMVSAGGEDGFGIFISIFLKKHTIYIGMFLFFLG